jgi:hypothetical protein
MGTSGGPATAEFQGIGLSTRAGRRIFKTDTFSFSNLNDPAIMHDDFHDAIMQEPTC